MTEMLQKIYKYGFFTLFVIIIVLLNVIRINNIKHRKIVELCELRLNTLFVANNRIEREFNAFTGTELFTKESINFNIDSKYFFILLSRPDCSKCQEEEMKRLEHKKRLIESKGFKIFGLVSENQKNRIVLQKKILKLSYPICSVSDSVFTNLSGNNTPQIIIVKKGIISIVFLPLKKDFKYSEKFYDILQNI